jgi:undecaprenyl pyrophosphate phosphatase UppP
MGLGGAASVLPGISGVGTAVSVASICGVERSYGLSMVLLMNLAATVCLIVHDIISIVTAGMESLSLLLLISYIVSAAAAFFGTTLAVRVMRHLAAEKGYSVFAYYCWGVSLFTFILNLLA